MKRLIPIILLFLLIASQAWATDYYVSPTGSASCVSGCLTGVPCSRTTGLTCVTAGDSLIFKDGTYDCTGSTYCITLPTSGTAIAPIHLKAENKWSAIITGATHSAIYVGAGKHDWHIEDLDLSGNAISGIWSYSGDATYNILFYRNKVHNNTRTGVFFGVDSHDITYDSNLIYTNGTDTNQDHGLYICGYNQTIQNNIIYDIPHGWPIQICIGGSGSNGDNIKIINNTIDGQNAYSQGHIVFYRYSGTNDFSNVLIQNNISYNAYKSLVRISYLGDWDWTTNLLVKNNLWYGTGYTGLVYSSPETFTEYTLSNNIIGQNPLLFDAANRDYHLSSNSPAINVGLAANAPSTDFDGNARPQNTYYDIGAYESLTVEKASISGGAPISGGASIK